MNWDGYLNDKLKSKQYPNKSDAKKDILNALRAFAELHPEEDTYVHTDGTTKHLLNLTGTIPVNYKGAKYNIPVQIWLLQGHPFNAPLVYVRPTSSMVIKPSKHVDQAGRVYLPYLTEWRSFSQKGIQLINLASEASLSVLKPNSDSYGLINMLCMIFATECPVYARPASIPPRPSYTPAPYPTRNPGPGYPTSHGGSMPMPGMQPVHPYPAHGGYPNANSSSQPPYSAAQTTTPYPVTSSYQPQQPNAAMTGRIPERQGSVIAEEHLRASLLSTAEDKLKRRVKEVFQMGKHEMETLQTTKFDLEKGNRNLQEMITRMKDEQANITSNVSLLAQKNEEIEDVIKKLEQDSENMNIDEAVITTAPLYNQILNLFAEENAVEDAIYYLSDALRREVVELEVFLKTVRTLSSRQFMLRATLQKARATAGLSFDLIH